MKLFFLSLILIFISLSSCGNPSEEIETTEENIETTVLFGDKNFVFPDLSENAKNYGMQWGAFEDFEIEAKSLNGSTIDGLRTKTTRLIQSLDSISKKVPDTLNTKPIVSRVTVAKTRAMLLQQEVQKATIDSVTIQLQIKEMNIAAKNLIIQVNEKFLKDAIDFERIDSEKKEIESQKRLLDSIFKQEIKDNKSN
jgi:phenylalanyl-tRNA synthetase alpha subunit